MELEKRIQYKWNNSVIASAIKDSAKELYIKTKQSEPINIYFKSGIISLDTKLIDGNDTIIAEAEARDAQFLACWDWRDQKFITRQLSPSSIDLSKVPEYEAILECATNKLKNGYGPLISISNIDLSTGRADFKVFK